MSQAPGANDVRDLLEPFFMSAALRRFAAARGFDDAELAAWLGCSSEALLRLALLRQPEPGDVACIAEIVGADPHRLAAVLRETGR